MVYTPMSQEIMPYIGGIEILSYFLSFLHWGRHLRGRYP